MTPAAAAGGVYLFGYGSLMFKPPLLPSSILNPPDGLKKYHGVLYGYKRSWSQLSIDHRGSPIVPGVVVNIVKDESPEILAWEDWFKQPPQANPTTAILASASAPPTPITTTPSSCFGCVYYIPPEICDAVITDLDFREKGGYVRAEGKVELLDFTDDDETIIVDAVLYRGVIPSPPALKSTLGCNGDDNDGDNENDDGSENDDDKSLSSFSPLFHLHPTTLTPATIATSIGPSGPNYEYISRISHYVMQWFDQNEKWKGRFGLDEHTADLLSHVEEIRSSHPDTFFYCGCGDNGSKQLNLVPLDGDIDYPEHVNHLRHSFIHGGTHDTMMVGAGGQTTTFLNRKTGWFRSFGVGKFSCDNDPDDLDVNDDDDDDDDNDDDDDDFFEGISSEEYVVGGGGYDRRLFGCLSACGQKFIVKEFNFETGKYISVSEKDIPTNLGADERCKLVVGEHSSGVFHSGFAINIFSDHGTTFKRSIVCFDFEEKSRRFLHHDEPIVSVCIGRMVETYFSPQGGYTFPCGKGRKR